MAEQNVSNIYINPNLIHMEKKDGSPIVNKDGDKLARISIPPKDGGEWGTFFVKADKIKEAKSETKNGDKYKYISYPKEYEFHVTYGDQNNRREETITAEKMAESFNQKKEKEAAAPEVEQEGPEIE